MNENVKSSYRQTKFGRNGGWGTLATPTTRMLCISKIQNIPLEPVDFRDVFESYLTMIGLKLFEISLFH